MDLASISGMAIPYIDLYEFRLSHEENTYIRIIEQVGESL